MRHPKLSIFLRRRAAVATLSHAQPFARIAELLWGPVGGVVIDTQTPAVRPHPDGVEVRGWLLVRRTDLPGPGETATARVRLEQLPALTRRIFLMNRSDGLIFEEIAERLGLSLGEVRRHMMRAIAALDGRSVPD